MTVKTNVSALNERYLPSATLEQRQFEQRITLISAPVL
jgi:hypothetical protein